MFAEIFAFCFLYYVKSIVGNVLIEFSKYTCGYFLMFLTNALTASALFHFASKDVAKKSMFKYSVLEFLSKSLLLSMERIGTQSNAHASLILVLLMVARKTNTGPISSIILISIGSYLLIVNNMFIDQWFVLASFPAILCLSASSIWAYSFKGKMSTVDFMFYSNLYQAPMSLCTSLLFDIKEAIAYDYTPSFALKMMIYQVVSIAFMYVSCKLSLEVQPTKYQLISTMRFNISGILKALTSLFLLDIPMLIKYVTGLVVLSIGYGTYLYRDTTEPDVDIPVALAK